jgi:hypothetical protein
MTSPSTLVAESRADMLACLNELEGKLKSFREYLIAAEPVTLDALAEVSEQAMMALIIGNGRISKAIIDMNQWRKAEVQAEPATV